MQFIEVKHKQEGVCYVLESNSPMPEERKPVLLLVEGYAIPFVGYLRIWSTGPFFVIPGGTPESIASGKPFKVTHYCDCLPDKSSYSHLLSLGKFA